MKKNLITLLCSLFIVATLIIPTSATLLPRQPGTSPMSHSVDYDPLDDHIIVTLTITEIRPLKIIDVLSDPDFYVRVTINDEAFLSDVWNNVKYVTPMNLSFSTEVPKENEFVAVTIALWDKHSPDDRLCDLSPDGDGNATQDRTVELTYSIATGIWWGDDYLTDPSGYGRLNGCDDGSVYQQHRDCELWFDITQTDYDSDTLPYWLETTLYQTNPQVDNRGEDADADGIPIEWEHAFGVTYDDGYSLLYDPFTWEDHRDIDSDDDGLTNVEEYKTWQWGSDPFRQDMFLELDQMAEGPNGEGSRIPTGAYDLIRDSHAKHNIVWHVDDGRLGGGELIPYVESYEGNDLNLWYWTYFMHKDINNWRRGIFHWGVTGHDGEWARGFTFQSEINNIPAIDCFYLSSVYHDSRVKNVPLIDSLIRKTFNSEEQRAIVYAGAIMHETGHSLGIHNPGVDNFQAVWPWQAGYWFYGPYKSVMNYRYIYTDLVDYSDGSHGVNDFDDWGTLDLARFNPGHW